MICKHCSAELHPKRVEMGYHECVNCSTTQRWSANPLIFHKTGNTTEIIKDPEVAADLAFASARKGFGVLRGMTSQRKPRQTAMIARKRKEEPARPTMYTTVLSTYKPKYYFEEVGNEMMHIFETQGKDIALNHINIALTDKRIYKKQADQLIQILNTINYVA
jgi:hypothetical protein